MSGSGKSTISNKLGKGNQVISLDLYIEARDRVKKGEILPDENRKFSSFVNKKDPELIYDIRSSKSKIKRHSKEWSSKVNKLMGYSEEFGKNLYPKSKVIIEGIQLLDDTVYPDKKFFRDKPVITTGTNIMTSMYRASKRDEVPLRERFETIQSEKEYINWYFAMNKDLKNFNKSVQAKRGEKWLKDYLKEENKKKGNSK